MSKPIFLYWAHREFWQNIIDLVEHCSEYSVTEGKARAFLKLVENHPNMQIERPMSWCFACEAALKYIDKPCAIACPLDWLANRGLTDVCYDTCGRYDAFVRAWDRGDIEAIRTIAEVIMNLPLKSYAHNKYDIKETPDD